MDRSQGSWFIWGPKCMSRLESQTACSPLYCPIAHPVSAPSASSDAKLKHRKGWLVEEGKGQCPVYMPLARSRCKHSSRSLQFSSVTQSCPTLCNPMNCSTPGFPVHHQLPELTQTYVHQVCDAIQPSHPMLSPSPPTFNLSQYQGLFK